MKRYWNKSAFLEDDDQGEQGADTSGDGTGSSFDESKEGEDENKDSSTSDDEDAQIKSKEIVERVLEEAMENTWWTC
jgi:hypothetical protein